MVSPLATSFSNSSTKLRHVYLTWQHDPCHTMTINVHGIKTPSEITIYYDTHPHFSKISDYPHKVSGRGESPLSLPDKRQLYHIELTDLKPGERYYFTIGDSIRAYGNELCFRTIPNDESTLTFVEGGDWENTPVAETLAKKASTFNPMATLLGGDYPSLVLGLSDYRKWDQWLDVYGRTMMTSEGCLIPLVMAIGNHEVIGGFNQSKEQAPFFFHYFRQGDTQESYFSLVFGKRMQLLVLDSGHVTNHGGKQHKWLTEELEKQMPVKMAMYHVPLFPSLRFCDKNICYRSVYRFVEFCKGKYTANKLFSRESHLGREYWLPLFDKYGLTVAFEHHDQTLKRTKLIKHGMEDKKGTLYLGDGGWGSKFQYPPIQGYFNYYFAALKGKVHFFWLVQIESEKITYRAIDTAGDTIDTFMQKIY